jgi:uncharacterized damage-inducible protein DinB
MPTPLVQCLAAVLSRELHALRREVEAYPDDDSPWATREGLPNAGGNLVLHLCGGLRHFVGAMLGQSGYVRDRPREFAAIGLKRIELLAEIAEAESVVSTVIPALSDADLGAPFPETLGGATVETADFLLHLCAHLGYHLGQVDYHRRIVTGNSSGVGALPIHELRTAIK